MTILFPLIITGSNQPPRFLNYFFSTYLLIYEDMPVGESLWSSCMLYFDVSLWSCALLCQLVYCIEMVCPLYVLDVKLRKRKQQVKRVGIKDIDSDGNGCVCFCMCVVCLSLWWEGISRAWSSEWFSIIYNCNRKQVGCFGYFASWCSCLDEMDCPDFIYSCYYKLAFMLCVTAVRGSWGLSPVLPGSIIPSPYLFFCHFLLVAVIDRAIWRCLAFHLLWGCQWLRIKILYIGLIF